MSGIINSAGSRSGVIGTTELDYEEGTFAPYFSSGATTTPTVSGVYTKIGNTVTCWASFNPSITVNGTAWRISGMPFTNGGTPAISVFSACRTQMPAYATKYWIIDASTTVVYALYEGADYTAPVVTLSSSSGTVSPPIKFTITYRI